MDRNCLIDDALDEPGAVLFYTQSTTDYIEYFYARSK